MFVAKIHGTREGGRGGGREEGGRGGGREGGREEASEEGGREAEKEGGEEGRRREGGKEAQEPEARGQETGLKGPATGSEATMGALQAYPRFGTTFAVTGRA